MVSRKLCGGDQSIGGGARQNCEGQTATTSNLYIKKVKLGHLHPSWEVWVHCNRDIYLMWIMTFLILLFSVKQEMTENSPLGDLLRGSVDVSSCQIGERPLHFLSDSVLSPCHRAPSFSSRHMHAHALSFAVL